MDKSLGAAGATDRAVLCEGGARSAPVPAVGDAARRNLSDPGMEDLLYEVESVRRVRLRLTEALPDETTLRHRWASARGAAEFSIIAVEERQSRSGRRSAPANEDVAAAA